MFRSMSRLVAVAVVAFSLLLVTAPAVQAAPGKLVKPRAAQQETLLQKALAWLNGILISVTGADEEEPVPAPSGPDDLRLHGGPCIDPLGQPCEDMQP